MITASIVTYRSDIEELERIVRCTLDGPVEKLYIIDNSPTDELRDISKYSKKIRYYFGHGNVGYGAGHNIALQESIIGDAKYHIVINPDIYFKKGTIESLTAYMDEHPDVGMVMPKVTYPNGDIQHLCKLLPNPANLIFRRFMPTKIYKKSNDLFEMRFTGYETEMNVPFLSGCFMFLRMDAIKNVGMFDDYFFMYGEDIDLSRRIHVKYKTVYFPKATIIHSHAAASYKNGRMLWIHIKNISKYFNKWGWFFDSERRVINRRILDEWR